MGNFIKAFILTILACPAWAGPVDKIVVFKDSASARFGNSVTRGGGRIVKEMNLINGAVARFQSEEMASRALDKAGDVLFYEDDEEQNWFLSEDPRGKWEFDAKAFIEQAAEIRVPDPKPAVQYSTTAVARTITWNIAKVNPFPAWAKTVGGKGVKVCVIDSGMDLDHPDLAANYAGGYNFIEPGKPPEDDKGHGTHVTGIIAGVYNEIGILGVAPKVAILEARVTSSSGAGKVSDIISGMGWCVNNGAHVANTSIGTTKEYQALHLAAKKMREAGVTLIAASGNLGHQGVPVYFPAAYPEVIAVSGSAPKDTFFEMSCSGPEIDFIAPGVDIWSTWVNGAYLSLTGTSQAAPHVTGLAALAVALGNKTPDEVYEALRQAAVKLPGLTDHQQGFGLITGGKIPGKK